MLLLDDLVASNMQVEDRTRTTPSLVVSTWYNTDR